MPIQFNEATRNRPGEDRVINAPLVYADLEQYIHQLKQEPAWNRNDRNGITLHKADGYTTVLSCLHKNAVIKSQSVKGFLTMLVLRGMIDLTIETGTITLKEQQMIVLQPAVYHSVEARKETVLLLINRKAKASKPV